MAIAQPSNDGQHAAPSHPRTDHDDIMKQRRLKAEEIATNSDAGTSTGQHGGPPKTEHTSKDGETDTSNNRHNLISFPPDDPEDPYNWSTRRKIYVVVTGIVLVLNSTIGSSIASGTPQQVSQAFSVTDPYQLVLPISMYLVGYVLGPLAFGPLSETYGRKPVLLGTFALFTLFTLGAALSPNFAAYIIFRLLAGIGASSPISVVGGLYADIYRDPVTRGRAMSVFMAATTWGPICGPLVSGFASPALGWRWVYWLALILAGATWPIVLFCPESYGPLLLARRARRLRRETGDESIRAPLEVEDKSLATLLTVVLTRPVRMFLFEPLVLASCLYLAYVYGVFYLYLQAFPIIFPDAYGFSNGQVGLAFLPVGVGALVACAIYLYWDVVLRRAKARGAPWSQIEEYRRLPLACLGAPLLLISMFWLGWTARSDVHWAVPVMSALPYGVAYLLLFMALLNYLVDAYDVYAASASAASVFSRSLFGAVLPFGGKPLYENLGVGWACTLLGFLSLLGMVVPFVFLKYGGWLRERSAFCRELKARREGEEAEREQRRRSADSEHKTGTSSSTPSRDSDQSGAAEKGEAGIFTEAGVMGEAGVLNDRL